jgi:acyl carrier protein
MEEVMAGVKSVLGRVLGIAPDQIAAESAIRGLPNADSAAILEAALAIEDRFAIEFPDEVVFRLETVSEVADVVARLAVPAGIPA